MSSTTGKPDPSSPVTLADIAYALDHLAPDVPAHVDSRATKALEEIEMALLVALCSPASDGTPLGVKIRQLLGIAETAASAMEPVRVSDTDDGAR